MSFNPEIHTPNGPARNGQAGDTGPGGGVAVKPGTPDGTGHEPRTARERGDLQPPRRVGGGLLDPKVLWRSLPDAFAKFNPRVQIRNPVMFVVEAGSVLTTYSAIIHSSAFAWTITAWLWLTVLFANLAEAVAEGRGKAQAETLRRTKQETVARRLAGWRPGQADPREEEVPGAALAVGDYVLVEPGQLIPGDGDVVEGVASVDESAITGESAPVIRESGGDRSAPAQQAARAGAESELLVTTAGSGMRSVSLLECQGAEGSDPGRSATPPKTSRILGPGRHWTVVATTGDEPVATPEDADGRCRSPTR